jgi:hypothetical protein
MFLRLEPPLVYDRRVLVALVISVLLYSFGSGFASLRVGSVGYAQGVPVCSHSWLAQSSADIKSPQTLDTVGY